MSPMPGRLADYLSHIVDAIQRIESYVEGMHEFDFFASQISCVSNAQRDCSWLFQGRFRDRVENRF